MALVALFAAGCGASHSRVRLRVSPADAVEDQAVRIEVDGLAPHQQVRLGLRSTDAKGVAFASRASFVADGKGVVDLARAAPLPGGSYAAVWPMGLLTSMSGPVATPFAFYWWGEGPQKFVLTVTSKGRTIATGNFLRRFVRGRYTEVQATVAHQGFEGTFVAPAEARRKAAVLAFGGSEGGPGSRYEAARLAAHGIPALVIGYFHAPGLPDKLKNIPLEYFRTALQWLEHRPEVDPKRVSVFGISYGSEAALLLGVHYPKLVHGVAALVPSSVVTCAIVGAGRERSTGPACLGSPWTLNGKPLPHTAVLNNPKPWDNPQAVIPVERVQAPVFLACGTQDSIWSSCPYARAIVARRKAHGEPTELAVYPNAGHAVGSPDFIYEPGALASDMFVPDDERGREDLWPRLLTFLHATP